MKELISLLSEYKFIHDRQCDLHNAFMELDADADGFIPVDEMRHYMTFMGEALDDQELDYML